MAITKASLKRPPNISLHGPADSPAPHLVQLHLEPSDLSALEKSIRDGKGAQLIFGRHPTLKYATASKLLHVAPARSVHEIYTSQGHSNDLTLVGTVGHHAALEQLEKSSSSAEAAAQKLRESLNAYQRDRDSNKATLVNDVKLTKHARAHSNSLTLNSLLLSPNSKGRPHAAVPAPTSAPTQNAAAAGKAAAQRFCLLHLLAANPSTQECLVKQTRIATEDCSRLLDKVAERVDKDCWQLRRRSYRELDVWTFPYPSDEQRQSAVTNALRAFDRDRLDPSDPIRQRLLPKAERGKGKNLSNLHIDVAEIARKKKPESLRLSGDHRKLLANAGPGSGGRLRSPAAHDTSKQKKSAAAKESSPRRSQLLGHSPKPSPAMQPIKKPETNKQVPAEAKPVQTASPAKALSKAEGNEQKAAEEGRAEKKRKAQPTPKSSEFIHDSDEEADEAEKEMMAAKRRRISDDEDDSRGRAAISRQAVRRAPTQGANRRGAAQQLPSQSKDKSSASSSPSIVASTKQERPLPKQQPATGENTKPPSQQQQQQQQHHHHHHHHQQNPTGRSRDSSTSSLSVSSPLTPLDSTPRSTASSTSKRSSDLSPLEHRYHAAFKKRMRTMFGGSVSSSPSYTPIIAEYERSALDLAAAMGVHIDDLYVPSGAHFFPAPALQSLAAKYNALFPAYQAARRRIRDGAVDGTARRKLLGEVRVLERQLKYVKGLYDAATESRHLENLG